MRKRSVSPSNPTITNAANNVLLAANQSRTYLFIRNRTAGTILLGLNGQTLTGLTETLTNPGLPLLTGEWYECTDETCPTGAITVWQASGSSTNLIHVMEG